MAFLKVRGIRLYKEVFCIRIRMVKKYTIEERIRNNRKSMNLKERHCIRYTDYFISRCTWKIEQYGAMSSTRSHVMWRGHLVQFRTN